MAIKLASCRVIAFATRQSDETAAERAGYYMFFAHNVGHIGAASKSA